MRRNISLWPMHIFCLVLCLAGCGTAGVAGQANGSPIQPKKILVVGIMGGESNRGYASFDAALARELQACRIAEQSLYKDMGQPGVSLSNNDQLFENTVRQKINEFQPDAVLEVTAVSNTTQNPNSLLVSHLSSTSYAINLTEQSSKKIVWTGKGEAGDVLGIDSRAELAKEIMKRIKQSGVLGSCS